MKLRALIRTVAAAATIGFAVPASAGSVLTLNPTVFTFDNNHPFSLLLDVSPTLSDTFRFQAKGAKFSVSLLDYSLSGSTPTDLAAGNSIISGANRLVVFSDASDGSVLLEAGKHYQLALHGQISPTAAGGKGDISVSWKNATVTLVPEPETYALMLAGLALVGGVARRKSAT
jgi:hypothetical protein